MIGRAGRYWRILTILWTAVIALLTLLPSDRLPPTPAWRLLSFDTAAHAGVFLVLAVMLRRWWQSTGGQYSALGTFAAALAYGALIEWLQTSMHLGRHGEWSDLLSDGLGALIGVVIATLIPLRR